MLNQALTIKLKKQDIRNIVSTPNPAMNEHDRDEMAIPSYLHSNPLIRWLMWRRYEVIAQMAQLKPGQSVFEFGCGVGLFLPTLAQRTGRVFAMDLFPQYAKELVRQRSLSVTFLKDLEDLEDESLDLIIAADVMEHLDEPSKYAAAFHRKLKKGGRLVISGPTESGIYKVGRFIAGFSGKGDYHHTNVDRLEVDIKGAGFEHEKMVPLPFALGPALFKIHLFRK